MNRTKTNVFFRFVLFLQMNKNTGRIVVTASGVHDPESPGGNQGETATLGDLKGLEQRNFEMVDGGPFSADKAYKDSKVRSEKQVSLSRESMSESLVLLQLVESRVSVLTN
jgi:hypothetical protein